MRVVLFQVLFGDVLYVPGRRRRPCSGFLPDLLDHSRRERNRRVLPTRGGDARPDQHFARLLRCRRRLIGQQADVAIILTTSFGHASRGVSAPAAARIVQAARPPRPAAGCGGAGAAACCARAGGNVAPASRTAAETVPTITRSALSTPITRLLATRRRRTTSSRRIVYGIGRGRRRTSPVSCRSVADDEKAAAHALYGAAVVADNPGDRVQAVNHLRGIELKHADGAIRVRVAREERRDVRPEVVVRRVAGECAVYIDVDRRAVERNRLWLRRERPAEVDDDPQTVAPWPGVSIVPKGSTLEALSTTIARVPIVCVSPA